MASYTRVLFSEKKRNVFMYFFLIRYVQLRSQALFLPRHRGESPGTRLRHVSRSGSTETKKLRPLPQSNNTVFLTFLSLLFSVASFSGETVRGDAAADIVDKTVSLQRIDHFRVT